jgi:hypothetical protein
MIKSYIFPAMLLLVGNASGTEFYNLPIPEFSQVCKINDLKFCLPGVTDLSLVPSKNIYTCCNINSEDYSFPGYHPYVLCNLECASIINFDSQNPYFGSNDPNVCKSLKFENLRHVPSVDPFPRFCSHNSNATVHTTDEDYSKLLSLEEGHSFPSWFEPLEKSEEPEFLERISDLFNLKKSPTSWLGNFFAKISDWFNPKSSSNSWLKLREHFSKDPYHAAMQAKLCDLIAKNMHLTQELLEFKRKNPALFKFVLYYGVIYNNIPTVIDASFYPPIAAVELDWLEQEKANTSFAVKIKEQFSKVEDFLESFKPPMRDYCDAESALQVDPTSLRIASRPLGLGNVSRLINIFTKLEQYPPYLELQKGLMIAIQYERYWTQVENDSSL